MKVGDNSAPNPALRAQQAADRGEQAYKKAKKEGVGGYAIDFWDGAAKNADKAVKSGESWWITGNAKWAGAKVMGFFARMSGFDEVEGRAAQNKTLWKDGDATAGEKAKAGAWMVFETGLALLNFTGVAGIGRKAGGKVVAAAAKEGAEAMARFGIKEGAAAGSVAASKLVRGMLPATPEAAAAVKTELAALLRKLPTAGKLGAAEIEMMHKGLTEIGKKYGIEVVFKTGAPQVLPSAGKIVVAGTGAQAHEAVHIIQTVQTQGTAIKSFAQRLGKEIAELTPRELEQAYAATAKTLETQGYRHFEEHAFKAAGTWGSKINPAKYKQVVMEGLEQFEKALVTGTMPDVAAKGGAKFYGDLAGLGQSQGQIFLTLGNFWSAIITPIKRTFNP